MENFRQWVRAVNAAASAGLRAFWGHWYGKLFTVSSLVTVFVTVLEFAYADEINEFFRHASLAAIEYGRTRISAAATYSLWFLLCLLAFVLIAGVIETSRIGAAVVRWIDRGRPPEPAKEDPAPPLLTAEQSLELNPARVFWDKHGKASVSAGLNLQQHFMLQLAARNYYLVLLTQAQFVNTLRRSKEQADTMLGRFGRKNIAEVVDHLSSLYRQYMQLACWLNFTIDQYEQESDPSAKAWRELHRSFKDELDTLSRCGGYDNLKGVTQNDNILDRFPEDPSA